MAWVSGAPEEPVAAGETSSVRRWGRWPHVVRGIRKNVDVIRGIDVLVDEPVDESEGRPPAIRC